MSHDDTPLATEPAYSDHLRRLLDAGRADGPDAAQAARLSARLAPLLGPTSGPPGAPGGAGTPEGAIGGAVATPARPFWSLPAAKAGIALLVAALGGTAAAVLGEGWQHEGEQARPAGSTLLATSASASSPVELAASAEPVQNVFGAGSAAVGVSDPGPMASTANRAAPRTAVPSSQARKDAPPSAPASRAPSPFSGNSTEIDLLDRAQRALAAAPAEALALSDEHGRRFADGPLAPEREVIAISALVALDRRDEARQRAARFRAEHPGSAYLRRIEVVLAK